jgi:hypothetical protein
VRTPLLVRWNQLALPYRVSISLLTGLALREVSVRTEGFQSGPVLCVFRNLTGLPCPFCGSTRSVGQILQGNFAEAFAFNPMGFLLSSFVVLMAITPTSINGASQQLARSWERLSGRSQVVSVILVISLLWILNIPRFF